MERSPPKELIDDLRSAARVETCERPDDPIDDVLEWEAADWIEAACAVLEQVKAAGGDLALTAIELLGGDFPVTSERGMSRRWD